MARPAVAGDLPFGGGIAAVPARLEVIDSLAEAAARLDLDAGEGPAVIAP